MTAPRARRMTRSARGCRRSRKRKQFLRGKGEEKDYSREEVEGKPGRSGVVANSRFLTGKERRFGMTKCSTCTATEGRVVPRFESKSVGAENPLILFWVGEKAVSDAANGEEVARARGIGFDVAPEPDHEIVDGASVGVFVQAPDFFENFFARDYTAIA